jgi:rare lipoprotein A (peptidoglycan hydrolase)
VGEAHIEPIQASLDVTINDREPNARRNQGRIIDISKPAALALGMTKAGVAKVRLEEFKSAQTVR